MNLVAENWKSPLVLLVAVLLLYVVALRVDGHHGADAPLRAAPASAPARAPAPAAGPADGQPPSNDIPALQQLGAAAEGGLAPVHAERDPEAGSVNTETAS